MKSILSCSFLSSGDVTSVSDEALQRADSTGGRATGVKVVLSSCEIHRGAVGDGVSAAVLLLFNTVEVETLKDGAATNNVKRACSRRARSECFAAQGIQFEQSEM